MIVQRKYFAIEVCPDGVVKIDAAFSGGSIINSNQWRSNSSLLEGALERAFNNPRVHKWSSTETSVDPGGRGPCLPCYVLINTPIGSLPIKNLRIGDYVWTIDKFGRRVKTVIVNKTKRVASKNHKMVHIVLKDGRELFVSPGHPTIDYIMIGSLVKGDKLDGSYVSSIKMMPYKGKYTYDILPYGATGGYRADGILIGSTLSNHFERTISDGLYNPLAHYLLKSF